MAKKLSEDIADLLLNERVTITLSDETTHNFVQRGFGRESLSGHGE